LLEHLRETAAAHKLHHHPQLLAHNVRVKVPMDDVSRTNQISSLSSCVSSSAIAISLLSLSSSSTYETILGWGESFMIRISVMMSFVLSLLSAIFFTATFFRSGVNARNTSPAAPEPISLNSE
jgi:hypothetical protein